MKSPTHGKKSKISKTNYHEVTMGYQRTEKQRQLKADLIHRWKPWEKSTGPKTKEGKEKVSKNAYKGGTRPLLRKLAKALKKQSRYIENHNKPRDSSLVMNISK